MSGLRNIFEKLVKGGGKAERPFCTCIVPAAGSARRMKGKDKLMEPVGGLPVIQRTLMTLEACPYIDEIIVVTREDLIVPIGALCVEKRLLKIKNVIQGGDTRTESVWLGVQAASPKTALIAVHDGARPFPSEALLEEVLKKGAETGAAAPAVPVKDTIKRGEQGLVEETLERSSLFAIQTPQVFEYGLFYGALSQAIQEGWAVTDDCSVVEKIGFKVTLTQGEDQNIKLTTPLDLVMGEAIAQWQQSE
jgi:2-C-methyl-D-erythritol 4-phosphate cytidylyltransferase